MTLGCLIRICIKPRIIYYSFLAVVSVIGLQFRQRQETSCFRPAEEEKFLVCLCDIDAINKNTRK